MKAALISAIIPTFNRAGVLSAAIDSVIAQAYPRVEIIVVDDGSTDETSSVVARYGSRVRSLRQPNGGASAARNAGLGISRGDIIAFLDSDDLWLPGKLQRQVALLDRAGPDIPCCISNMKLAYADGRRGTSFDLSLLDCDLREGIWVNVLSVLTTRFVLFNQCVAIRRGALEKVGGFDERCAYMEDYDLAMRLALLGPWAFTAEPLAVWNEGSSGSLTSRAAADKPRLQQTILDIHRKVGVLARGAAGCAPGPSQLAFERGRLRVRLKAAIMASHASVTQRALGRSLGLIERLADKLYTNSPLYPQMQTLPLASSGKPFAR